MLWESWRPVPRTSKHIWVFFEILVAIQIVATEINQINRLEGVRDAANVAL